MLKQQVITLRLLDLEALEERDSRLHTLPPHLGERVKPHFWLGGTVDFPEEPFHGTN